MKDRHKTKEQLIKELVELRKRISELEKSETQRKRTEEALRRTEQEKAAILNSISEILIFQDLEHRLMWANRAAGESVGLALEQLVGRYCYEIWAKRSKPCIGCPVAKARETGQPQVGEMTTPDGRVWFLRGYPTKDTSDNVVGMVEAVLDITKRKQAEQALRKSEEKYRTLYESSKDGIAFFDMQGNLVDANQAFLDMLGYTIEEIKKWAYQQLTPKKWHEMEADIIKNQIITRGYSNEYEKEYIKKDGTIFPVTVRVWLINDEQGNPTGMWAIVRDITERKRAEERIKYLTLHDSLTGLYNRTYFEEEMKRLNTIRKYPVGIIMADIDNLKLVNDAFGHEKGDELLKHLANILTSVSRKEDVVARIGGDEFAVILPNVDEKTVESFCKRITNACKDSNRESSLKLSVSLGYAVQYGQYKDMHEALKTADDHMYKDKLLSSRAVQKRVIDSLTFTLAQRDPHIEKHGEEFQELAVSMGRDIGVPEHRLKDLRLLAILHNIGKVGIPDSILYKPDKLSPEEWEIMKRHCEMGYRIAKNILELAPIAEDILSHPEWWNGNGYPKGLKGEKIPILARIISIVDAYNAMLSERPYKKARSREEAIKELKRCAGTQFDPKLVGRFLKIVGIS